ncbi:MAG: HDIG domain-containing metalloprotein, partial [Verrucomicrobiota bacterium]
LGQIQWPGFDAEADQWQMFAKQALSAILVSTLTAVVVSGLLPLIEAAFRITTDVSWIELSDLNHPLLKKMTIEAPGTYHHSLVVATLAETAAEAIGARSVMCRVCSYFHDIGKMNKPEYFVENIGDGHNPHDDLTPNMSALIVMAHVKDGVDMAIKHKLNAEIVNVIREHHGTSLIQFFYHRALKLRDEIRQQYEEGKAHEEDIPEVKEESFRYAGPKPRTRESAIISLADSVESASRSLQKPTVKKINEMIDGIFRDRLTDGQLDDAALTLSDLATIKNSFSKTLRSMMHTRIEYPKIEEGADKPKGSKKKTAKTERLTSSKEEEPTKAVPG